MLNIDSGELVPVMIFAIPIVAIIGGITLAIVRSTGQQRLIELAQRERIAAIEKGVDPSKLPPLPILSGHDDVTGLYLSPRQAALRRAQGLLIGGLVTVAVAIGLGLMLALLSDQGDRAWPVSLIPGLVGVALLVSSFIVRASAPEETTVSHPPYGQ